MMPNDSVGKIEKIELQPAESPVSEAMIFLCEKCGKKLARSAEENPARELQQLLKSEIKALGAKGRLRASVASCMDLCPSDELAICISKSSKTNQFFTLPASFQRNIDGAAKAILERIGKI